MRLSTSLAGRIARALRFANHAARVQQRRTTYAYCSDPPRHQRLEGAGLDLVLPPPRTLCAIGLAYLPGNDLDRAFMVMGYVFCLSTAFALAKFVRDNELRRIDTPMWGIVVVWAASRSRWRSPAGACARMDINPTYKAFLGVRWLFLISSVFTLAKTLRDAHEALLAEARRDGMAMRSPADAA